MTTLFSRARAYLPLTPAERALLKLVEGLLCVALVAALPVVADALSRQSVNWSDVVRAALAAASVAVLLSLAKYAKAHGDPALPNLLETASATLSHQAGLSDPDTSSDTPPAPLSAATVPAPTRPDSATSSSTGTGAAA